MTLIVKNVKINNVVLYGTNKTQQSIGSMIVKACLLQSFDPKWMKWTEVLFTVKALTVTVN